MEEQNNFSASLSVCIESKCISVVDIIFVCLDVRLIMMKSVDIYKPYI